MTDWKESETVHVVSRMTRCCVTGCRSMARWDLSVINSENGGSSDWMPACTYHARELVKALERDRGKQ